MRHMLLPTFVLSCLLYFTACEKPPIYDDTPTITWGNFSTDTVQQLSGAIDITFSFTDGDGDLGKDGDPEDHILVIDTRRTPNDTMRYKIPTIDPQGIVSGISGEITVTMSQICGVSRINPLIMCQIQPNYYDPVVYKIAIKDNAGRWSNNILSDTLYIKCFD